MVKVVVNKRQVMVNERQVMMDVQLYISGSHKGAK